MRLLFKPVELVRSLFSVLGPLNRLEVRARPVLFILAFSIMLDLLLVSRLLCKELEVLVVPVRGVRLVLEVVGNRTELVPVLDPESSMLLVRLMLDLRFPESPVLTVLLLMLLMASLLGGGSAVVQERPLLYPGLLGSVPLIQL